MKKMFLSAVGLALFASSLYAACHGPYCYDDTGAQITAPVALQGGLRLPVYTVAQINGLLGPTTGQALIECFNCTQGPGICRSTATAAGSWVILASTGGLTNNGGHCQ